MKLKFVVVDDDPDSRAQLKELIEGEWENCVVSVFEQIPGPTEVNRVDAFVIDISAVAGLSGWEYAYGPICSIVEQHPGTSIFISSAVGRNITDSVIDDVKSRTSSSLVFYAGSGDWDTLKQTLVQKLFV